MKHIVHVVESFGAGVLSIIVDIANQQVKDGYRVSVVYSLRAETPKNWSELFDKQIHTHFLPMGRAIHPLRDLYSSYRLSALLRRIGADIVHLHSSKAGAVGRIASLFYWRAAYFFSPHGLSFLHGRRRVSKWLYITLEKLLGLFPARLIACSSSEARRIKKYITSSVSIVENAVSAESITVKKEVNPILRIGSVGRICPQKDPEKFARIARACKLLPVEFIWIGAGEPKSEKVLRQAGVQVTGWLERKKILEILPTWDIYLQTSRWEGMPIAVIEAMLAGLPTIVRNVIGSKDVVSPGETGFLTNSEQDFVKLIQIFVQDTNRILSMGQAARNYAIRHFSIENMVQKLYQVYRGAR